MLKIYMTEADLSKLNPDFNVFFRSVYGDRWQSLLGALLASEQRLPRQNGFCSEAQLLWNEKSEIPRSTDGLLGFYIMDPASQEPPSCLAVQPGDRVLDMCAAPGGKTLILAEALGLGPSGELIANEPSKTRRENLKKVLRQYLPESFREKLSVSGKDAGLFAKSHPDYFDRSWWMRPALASATC